MHEVSVLQQAMEIAFAQTRRAGAAKIDAVTLQIGDLSGVVPEAITFAFDVVTKNTIAEGASLTIERVPALCHCSTCDRLFTPPLPLLDCPTCANPSSDIRQGREIILAQLAIE